MSWSAATLVTPPATPAISVEQAKIFLRIDADTADFDGALADFTAAAIEQIEGMCSTRLAPQTVELLADEWNDLARLPIGPVTAITSIHYQDRAGVEQLLEPERYELFGAELERGIRLTVGSGWPKDQRAVTGAIRVTLVAGWATLPSPVRTAALYHVGDLFAFRETAVVGTIATKVPMSATAEDWLVNHRIWL